MNHADDGFAIGGVHYTNAELIHIMQTPVGGDATIILAYHLIAAKLNVLNGSDDSINGAIAEAATGLPAAADALARLGGEVVAGDVLDAESLAPAFEGLAPGPENLITDVEGQREKLQLDDPKADDQFFRFLQHRPAIYPIFYPINR